MSDAAVRRMPSAGMPAAMAPLVTTTTRSPSARRRATSSHSFCTAVASMTPSSSVMDDVPILTTTVDMSVVVVELEPADADPVALLGTGPGQGAIDAEALQAIVHDRHRLGVGEVVHGHGALGLAADHHVATVVAALDAERLGRRSVHGVGDGFRDLGPHGAHHVSELADDLARPGAGHGGDRE